MIPYKMKHKATGLYYKPGRPNLSKIGKVYGTGNNGLNYMGNNKFVNIISTKAPLSRRLESLGYKLRWVEFGTHCCFEIPIRKLLIGFVKTRFLYMVSMKILPNIIGLPLKRYLHIFI